MVEVVDDARSTEKSHGTTAYSLNGETSRSIIQLTNSYSAK